MEDPSYKIINPPRKPGEHTTAPTSGRSQSQSFAITPEETKSTGHDFPSTSESTMTTSFKDDLKLVVKRLRSYFYRSFDRRRFDIYIRPRGGLLPKSAREETFDIVEAITTWIKNTDNRSLLLLGDSGQGKTLLSLFLADHYWQRSDCETVLPIWIWIPTIAEEQRATHLLDAYFIQQGLLEEEINIIKMACQQGHCHLLVIIDGLDEIATLEENLYLSNGWWQADWPSLTVVTTCRPEALVREGRASYQHLFYAKSSQEEAAHEGFRELFLQLFTQAEIDDYLQQYIQLPAAAKSAFKIKLKAPRKSQKTDHLEKGKEKAIVENDSDPVDRKNENLLNWNSWEVYRDYLQTITPLNLLAKNPFILSIMVQALPAIIAEVKEIEKEGAQAHVYTRDYVYQVFVENWLMRQAKRLWKDKEKRITLSELSSVESLTHCLLTYSENLARVALNLGEGQLNVVLTDEHTLMPELVLPHPSCASYFRATPSVQIMKIIRSGCLLSHQGQHYQFLHKSIVEYFAARALFNGMNAIADSFIQQLEIEKIQQEFSLNTHLLMREPEIIERLADKVEKYPHFKEILYQVIAFSKQEPLAAVAAANAITILNVAGECFSGKDFSRTHLSGADLSNAICDGTNFSGADLSHVRLAHAWLRNADLSYASLNEVQFAELPHIQHQSPISNMVMDTRGEWLFITDTKGYLVQFSVLTGEVKSKRHLTGYSLDVKLGNTVGFLEVNSLAISQDSRWVGWSTADGVVHVAEVDSGRIVRQIVTAEAHERHYVSAKRIESLVFCSTTSRLILKISGRLEMWDIATGEFICELKGPYVYDLAISPNEKIVASFSNSKSDGPRLSLYHLDDKLRLEKKYEWSEPITLLAPFKTVFIKHIRAIKFSPMGKWFALVIGKWNKNEDHHIQLWDTAHWQSSRIFRPLTSDTSLGDAAFSPDETYLASYSNKGISVWHMESKEHLYDLVLPSSHSSTRVVGSLFFSPKLDTQQIFCYVGKMICSWPITPFSHMVRRRYHPPPLVFARLPKGKFQYGDAVIVNEDEWSAEIRIKETEGSLSIKERGEQTHLFNFKTWGRANYAMESLCLSVSPNRRYVAFAYINTDAMMKELEGMGIKGRALFNYLGGFMLGERAIRVWDLQQDKLLHTFSHHNQIFSMMFSADSRWIVTAGYTVRLWEVSSGKCLHRYGVNLWTNAVALSADNSLLAIADGTNSISIWETKHHRLLGEVHSIQSSIYKMLFSQDDQYLLCNDDLLFQLQPSKKSNCISIQLVNRSSPLNLNTKQATITSTFGLSINNQRLLQQKGAVGTASLCKINTTPAMLDELKDICGHQAVISVRALSIIDPKLPLTYNNWAVSLLRFPRSDNPDHAILIMEGINTFGRGVIIKLHLVNNTKQPGQGLILIDSYSNLEKDSRERFLKGTLLKQQSFEHKTWGLSRKQAVNLLADAKADQALTIQYQILGNRSILVNASDSEEVKCIHNCFTWAREKLHNLGDPRIQLPEKYTDFIGAKTSFYISSTPNDTSSHWIKKWS